jgi:uncharacterized protein (TIGR02246 family)
VEHESRIRESTAAFAAAVNRGDAEHAAGLYSEDARLLPPAADPIAGRLAIASYWRAGVALGVAVLLEPAELQLVGPFALEIGRYAFSLADRPAEPVDRGTYLVLHRRQADGSWRRSVDVFSPGGPAARPETKEEA